jgi:putative transposase
MPVSLLVRAVAHCLRTSSSVAFDLGTLALLAVRSRHSLAAENLFLRKQLALFLQERKFKPRRADDATRWLMATLGRMFPWRNALLNVKPDTLIRWQHKGFRLFWRWKIEADGTTTPTEESPGSDPKDGS